MEYVVKSIGAVKIGHPVLTRGGVARAIYRTQVKANFNKKTFSRRTLPDIEKQICETWKTKCLFNSRLYNASKFRLGGCDVSGETLVLSVGLTDYKDLCGTNNASNYQELRVQGINTLGDSQAYLSEAIGVGIILMTTDDCLVITRRAPWTAEFPQMLDRPGGHPEPGNIFTPSGELKPELQTMDINEAVMDEIWNSAAQEAEDEVGLPKEHLQDVTLLGLSCNVETGDRRCLEFFARLNLKSDEVQDLYNLGLQSEADESTAVHLIPAHISSFLPKVLWQDADADEEMTGAGDPNREDQHAPSSSFNEAKALIEESTPVLKAALALAHVHSLI